LAVRAGCEWLDIEARWKSPQLDQFVMWAHKRCSLIVSQHRMGPEAPRVSLQLLQDMAIRCRTAIPVTLPATIKIIGQAFALEDCDVMQRFMSGPFKHIAHPLSAGMIGLLAGDAGSVTRVRNSLLTPCTHESLQQSAAPGQLSAPQLLQFRKQLGLITPHFIHLFGSPISQSPSPAMHNAALESLSLHWYLRYTCVETSSLEDVRVAVSSPHFAGANVTIPLKTSVISLCDLLSPTATAIGAVNVLWRCRDTGELVGDNTDWIGIFAAISPIVSAKLPKNSALRVVVIGAGGTACAACYAAKRIGATELVIVNRTRANAQSLAARFGAQSVSESLDSLSWVPEVVICTIPPSSGLLLPVSWLVSGTNLCCVVDVAYTRGSAETALGYQVLNAKILFVNGKQMLLEQGVAAFSLWMAGRKAPRAIMENAICEWNKEL
jgi:pentafunctional AROM polypeptide